MKLALFLVLALLCLDVSTLSAAPQTEKFPQFPKELRDPAFLRQLTWRTDKGLENVVAGWRKFSDQQTSDGDLFIQRFTGVRILKSEFVATYGTSKTEGDAEIIMERRGDTVTDGCDALFTWAKGALGQPEKLVDLSTPRLAILLADWLFGQTRVQFKCFGGWIEPAPPNTVSLVVDLTYRHRERLPALKDPIRLDCSAQERWTSGDDQTVRQLPPIGFILDPNSDRLLFDNKAPWGETVKFTDEEIVAGFEDEKGAVKIRIDRVTGSYLRTASLKNDSAVKETWGKCVSVAPGKKF
jgi:hypothetical protein